MIFHCSRRTIKHSYMDSDFQGNINRAAGTPPTSAEIDYIFSESRGKQTSNRRCNAFVQVKEEEFFFCPF